VRNVSGTNTYGGAVTLEAQNSRIESVPDLAHPKQRRWMAEGT
jgi:hypothetical protein